MTLASVDLKVLDHISFCFKNKGKGFLDFSLHYDIQKDSGIPLALYLAGGWHYFSWDEVVQGVKVQSFAAAIVTGFSFVFSFSPDM
jgi:hypothetical protein